MGILSAMSKSDPGAPGPSFEKSVIKLDAAHRWRAAPGCSILVADGGAVRFEYPQAWRVIPKPEQIQLHDRQPPADECRITMTVFRLPRIQGVSWDDLPLDQLLQAGIGPDEKERHAPGWKLVSAPTLVQRPDMSYAWSECSWPDPENGKRVLTRQVVARARGIQPLISFDYYADRAADFLPVWRHLVDTLRLGAPVNLLGESNN